MEVHEWPIINLYSFLHLQNPIGEYFLSVSVPDTIFYENSIPRQWFFSKQQQVRMKSRVKLDDSYILHYFSQFKQDILAIWRTKQEFQVFDKKTLLHFLREENQKEGILQRFIYPKGNNNSSILVHWSQTQTFFEKFESKFNLNDNQLDVYQRGLTFERDPTLAQPIFSKSLTERLEHLGSSIASHANDLMKWKQRLIRMILEVKIDEMGQIWVLNCLSLQWSSQEQVPMKQLSLPNFVDTQKLLLKQTKNVLKEFQCEMCDKIMHQNDIMKTQIKYIIESWNFDHMGDNDKLLAAKSSKSLLRKKTMAERLELKQEVEQRYVTSNYLIPILIRKIFPKLKYSQYKELLGNPGFMEMELTVCYDCHIQIDKGVNVSQDIGKLAKQELLCPATYKGIQKLKPELLKDRFITTRKEILKKIANHGHRVNEQIPIMTSRVFQSTNTSRIIGISPVKSMLTSLLPKYSNTSQDTKLGKNTTTRTHSRRVSDLK